MPYETRVGKNWGTSRFAFGQIGYYKNVMPEPCLDHKSDTLTKLRPKSGCLMSGFNCPNVRIYDLIFGHFGWNFVWLNQNPIFQCLDSIVRIILIKFSREFGSELNINLLVQCLNSAIWLSAFVQTRNYSKFLDNLYLDSQTWTQPKFKFENVWLSEFKIRSESTKFFHIR